MFLLNTSYSPKYRLLKLADVWVPSSKHALTWLSWSCRLPSELSTDPQTGHSASADISEVVDRTDGEPGADEAGDMIAANSSEFNGMPTDDPGEATLLTISIWQGSHVRCKPDPRVSRRSALGSWTISAELSLSVFAEQLAQTTLPHRRQ